MSNARQTTAEVKKIFLVDDDKFYSELISDYLKSNKLRFNHRFEVTTFPVGELCIDQLHQKPDVIILDFHLDSKYTDVMDGFEIYREIRKRDMTSKVVFVSSVSSPAVISKLVEKGVTDFIVKNEEAPERVLKVCREIFETADDNLRKEQEMKRLKNFFYSAAALALAEAVLLGIKFLG